MAIQAQLYSENLGLGGSCSQDWMENGYFVGFNEMYFNLQQQQKQQPQQLQQSLQQQQQRNQNQNLFSQNNFSLPKNNGNNNNCTSSQMEFFFEKQRQEIDQFITLQNERLRLALQEQRKQLVVSILKEYESKAQILLRQKDEETTKAINRAMELEEFMRRIDIENQTWQRAAKENEAMVISLNNTIEKLREGSHCFSTHGAEDAESCCQTGENRGNGEYEGGKQGKTEERKMICKNCCAENSCFVFLPCRHLCSCKDCEAFLDSCPVCRMVKKASIEVLI